VKAHVSVRPRVLVDALPMQHRFDGINTYLVNLLVALAETPATIDVEVMAQLGSQASTTMLVTHVPWFSTWNDRAVPSLLWHLFILPVYLLLKHPQLLHIPTARRIPLFCPCPLVVTVHDLAAFRIRGKYGPLRSFYHRVIMRWLLKKAERIIAVSESTGRDLQQLAGVDRRRITIVHSGVSPLFRPRDCHMARAFLRDRYGVSTDRLILYVSRLEHPGKNHVALLTALRWLIDEHGIPHHLVFIGHRDMHHEVVFETITTLGLSDRVHVFHNVADADLPLFYNAAEVFVFPSLYEGFGLPLIEAMQSGIPIAAAQTSSIPEVCGDAAAFFDPRDPHGICDVLAPLLRDVHRRAELARRGLERANSFSWAGAAIQTLQVYDGVLRRGGAERE
jgi:glycosyltransferase involved in cell wall biosynthesis